MPERLADEHRRRMRSGSYKSGERIIGMLVGIACERE
jgi:hypothetical protein